MHQLIICRAFQGLGGAGCYSLATIITYEFVPKDKLGLYGTFNSVAVALATLAGPLLGGLINNHTTWRWVFYLNLPAGAFVMAVLFIGIPNGFPHQNAPKDANRRPGGWKGMGRLDIFGLTMLLAGSLMLSAVLLEYSVRHGWGTPGSVLLVIFALLAWIVFLGWEWYVAVGGSKVEALFPWEFIQDRVSFGTFLVPVPRKTTLTSRVAVDGHSYIDIPLRRTLQCDCCLRATALTDRVRLQRAWRRVSIATVHL